MVPSNNTWIPVLFELKRCRCLPCTSSDRLIMPGLDGPNLSAPDVYWHCTMARLSTMDLGPDRGLLKLYFTLTIKVEPRQPLKLQIALTVWK